MYVESLAKARVVSPIDILPVQSSLDGSWSAMLVVILVIIKNKENEALSLKNTSLNPLVVEELFMGQNCGHSSYPYTIGA